jgi:NTE family protein
MSGTTVRTADLVLEGGGVKGIALVGALAVLEEHGYIFPRIAGTSAGSIIGALVATGRTAAEMREIMLDTDLRCFRDTSLIDRIPAVGKALSVLIDHGIYEGDTFVDWLQQLLPPGVDTFGDLKLPDDPSSTLHADQRYRLVVMASDVSLGRIARLPWDYGKVYGLDVDRQRIVDAVRASMSIPFFFEPVRLHHGLGRVNEHGRSYHSTLVDGGMLSNFPVEVFDRPDGRAPRWPTFGIKLSVRPGSQQVPMVPTGPLSLARAMLGTMTGWYDCMHVDREEVVSRTIFVDTFGISATDFDLTRDDQLRLHESGRRSAEQFLESWDFQAYVERYRASPSHEAVA